MPSINPRLPEIPQAKASYRALAWVRERKRVLAGVAGTLLCLLLFLSLVPLHDEDAPGGETSIARAVLGAIPRWAGVRMERSDPEAMVKATAASQEAGGGSHSGYSRVSTRDYDVARRARTQPIDEAGPEPSAAKAAAFSKVHQGGKTQGSAGTQASGGAQAPAPAEAAPMRAAPAASVRSAAGPRTLGRRSGLAAGGQQGGAGGGRFGALTATRSQQAGGGGTDGPASNPPLPVTPIAKVPEVPAGVSRGGDHGDGGSGGGGGGGLSPGRAAGKLHRCAHPPGDAASLRCRVADCMIEEIREAYTPLLVVAMAAHGVRPPGAPVGGGGDLLGGMIEAGSKGATDFAGKAEVLAKESAGLAFHCAQPGSCNGLMSCRDFVVDQLERAATSMRESAATLTAASGPCHSLPGSGDSSCTAKLKVAAGLDRQAADRVRRALRTASGEGSTQCHSPEAAETRRWDDFRNALVGKLKPVLTTIEKPYCPDRLPCEPRGLEMLEEAHRKLEEVGRGVRDLGEAGGGLPTETAGAFQDAAQALAVAVPLMRAYDDSGSVNLFEGIEHVDSAAAGVGPAADAWGAAKASACAAH